MLFRAHCCTLWAGQLWCCYIYESYRRLRVFYNDSYHSIHGIPRYSSVRQYQVEANVDTFDPLFANFYSVLWIVVTGLPMCLFTHYFTLADFVVRNTLLALLISLLYCKWFGRSLLLFSGRSRTSNAFFFVCVFLFFFFFFVFYERFCAWHK